MSMILWLKQAVPVDQCFMNIVFMVGLIVSVRSVGIFYYRVSSALLILIV